MPTFKYTRNEDGEFVCPTCGVTKKNQNTMHYHMKKHEGSMPFSCRYCKKEFLQKQTLDMHIRSKHPDAGSTSSESETTEYECPFDGCKFSSMTKGNLRTHCLRTHFHEEAEDLLLQDEETKEIQCTACEHVFQSKGAFYYHCLKCITLPDGDDRKPHLVAIR